MSAVGLGRACPVDAAEGMAAAGFNNSIAIASGGETRPQSDMKRNVDRKRGWRLLGESRVYNNEAMKCREDVCIRIY